MKKNLPYRKDVSLKKYHTYGIDAAAKYLAEVTSEEELIFALEFAEEEKIPFLLLGRGSNVLFKDDYFKGLVIVNKMKKFEIKETEVIAQSGVHLQILARHASKLNLSGLEFLVGVPGTVGGSIYMNAGILNLEISKYLISVDVIYPDGRKETLMKSDLNFSYRSSIFHFEGGVIVSAKFNLLRNEDALDNLKIHLKSRLATQPIEKSNSGCIFKNPSTGPSAGYLIDSCGLKGMTVGGAEVSTKHGNFINNACDASYEDVMGLIKKIQFEVKRKTEVDLECEVQII